MGPVWSLVLIPIQLWQQDFADDKGPKLFGNKQQLLEEWVRRLGISIEEEL